MYLYPSLVRLRPVFAILVISCFFAFAVACSSAPPVPEPPATLESASESEVNALVLWHTLDDDKRKALEDLVNDFNKAYPDLQIAPVFVGGDDDLTKQMTAALALGNAPDLVLASRPQIADLARQNGLQPLDRWMSDTALGLTPEDRKDFLKGALNLGKFPTLANRTYGVPFDQEAIVLFYNSDLLKTANINDAPRTWQQFGEYGQAVTNENTYGWTLRADAAALQAMLVSRGSALLSDAETRALFNERAGLHSLRLAADMGEVGAAVLASSDDKARNAFASGKAAFYIGWMSDLETLQAEQKQTKTSFKIGLAPLPQIDAGAPWLLTRGDLFGIPAQGGKQADERGRRAWFFIRWITATTQAARWVRATDAIPLRSSALTFIAPDLPSNARFQQIAAAFDNVLPRLAPQPAPTHMDAIQEQVAGLWLQALQPDADVRAILDSAATRVNQILAVRP